MDPSRRLLKALYLTHHAPWPVTSGGRRRDASLVPRLAQYADLEVWAVSRTAEKDRAAVRERRPSFPVRVFTDEARRRIYPTRDSAQARARLAGMIAGGRNFDVVHIEGHYLFHLLPAEYTSRAVLVEHNVESLLLRQRARHGRDSDRLHAEIRAVERAEQQAWTRAARVLTLSEEDRQRVLARVPTAHVEVCPNGADHIRLQRPEPMTEVNLAPRIGFLANYCYPPNQDALRWLLDSIFPMIRSSLPGAELLLAGFGLDQVTDVAKLPPGVLPLGWVDDVAELWNKVDIAICPLRVGGGMKVKVIDAVRGGLPLVSTGIGLEGMPRAVLDAVVRADDAAGLAAGVVRISTDPALRKTLLRRLGEAQRAFPTWSSVVASTYRHWVDVALDSTAVGIEVGA